MIDARGGYVLPGLIQTHVHLCQTLFRGFADDLPLMDWLRTRVWPMEAAHTPATLRAAARLATTELLASGTTAVLTMETVHDTDVVFEAVAESGMRATIGKCMMDFDARGAGAAPGNDARVDRREPGDPRSDGTARRTAGCAPRSRRASPCRARASCSRPSRTCPIEHARAGAHPCVGVARRDRDRPADVGRPVATWSISPACISRLRACAPRTASGSDDREQALLAEHDVKVMHCPGSNLKLGSGVAPVPEMRARGITVSLGADGAACNNRLDMFEEMRLAAVLQAMRQHPGVLPARDVLWMATRAGARTLGLDDEIGSLEPGKRADIIVVDRDRLHARAGPDPYSTLVYAARGSDVRTTIVDGEVLVDDFAPVRVDRGDGRRGPRAAQAHGRARRAFRCTADAVASVYNV